MAVGGEGLEDGSEIVNFPDRHSFVTLFISVDHGESWVRDVALAQVDKGSSVVPADSPVMCPLKDGRLLVVMQAVDRHHRRKIDGEPNSRMSLIGNIIEPTDPRFLRAGDR